MWRSAWRARRMVDPRTGLRCLWSYVRTMTKWRGAIQGTEIRYQGKIRARKSSHPARMTAIRNVTVVRTGDERCGCTGDWEAQRHPGNVFGL